MFLCSALSAIAEKLGAEVPHLRPTWMYDPLTIAMADRERERVQPDPTADLFAGR